jgi:hypothetical protein
VLFPGDIEQHPPGMSAPHGRLHRDSGMPFTVLRQRGRELSQLFAVCLVMIDMKVERAAETLHRAAVPGVDGQQRYPPGLRGLEGEVDG